MEIPEHPLGGKVTNEYLTNDDGSVKVPALTMINKENSFGELRTALENYKWKDEDFLLATYPKNGTHFMWEIMTMLVKGSADYIKESKVFCMIDMFPVTEVDKFFPSPRVLNTHYRLDVLPTEFRDKKTVLVIRNPKDTAVSFFYHETDMMKKALGDNAPMKDMTFSSYLKMFLFAKDVPLGSYFDYIEYMWSLRDNPNLLVVYFEDLKRNPITAIEKVNRFMGTDRNEELVQQIAEATNFSKMKKGKAESLNNPAIFEKFPGMDMKTAGNVTAQLYRKGEIGDWKNHFTVADNELFDSVLEKWAVGKEIPFQYT